ncbi:MAG TPA: hypothetical protein VM242_15610, partial [Acidimicrobiales bacterium]|nr:hypothetical protein [Acidimicrobiales bacterium]
VALDTDLANRAARIVTGTGVSIADAHLGAVAQTSTGSDVVVLTSDPRDVVRASEPRNVTVVRI